MKRPWLAVWFTSVLFGVLAFASKDDPSDPKYVFNLDRSTSDTRLLNKENCITPGGVGNMTARVAATSIANRTAAYISAQPWVLTPNGVVSKGPIAQAVNQRIVTAEFDYIVTCVSIRLDGYYRS